MILLPSRGRPGKLKRFFDAYAATEATDKGIVMIEARDAEAYRNVELPANWDWVVVRESFVSKKFNDGALVYAPGESHYQLMADDCVPETKYWDKILADEAGTGAISYGNDYINPPPPCGHPCIGGALVRALGWIAHPGFGHFYWDNLLADIAGELDLLRYRPDVSTRHLHFTVTGDTDVFERGDPNDDHKHFELWKRKWREKDIERVKIAYGDYHRV